LKDAKYIIGIDLGTTHCVAAYTEARGEEDEERRIRIFPVPQVVSPGEVKEQPLLPSFLFLPGPHDVPPDSLNLPWPKDGVGEEEGESTWSVNSPASAERKFPTDWWLR